MPESDPVTDWFLSAFRLLSMGRPAGMQPGPIPLRDIIEYWEKVGQIGPLREFIAVIRAIDQSALNGAATKNDKPRRGQDNGR